VHTDRQFSTGEMPARTGVYVPVDDPHGVLQFAWIGSKEGALGKCNSLSPIGQSILSRVGRPRMWVDRPAMVTVVSPMYASGELTDRGGFRVGAEQSPDAVNGVISDSCFIEQPCKWYFVEKLEGQFDEPAPELAEATIQPTERLRCEAGQPCPKEGWWFTPAGSGRRYFKQGQIMPNLGSDFGQTIWQWAQDQS
jgi:hypothetical protein